MATPKQQDADTELLNIDSPLAVFWSLAGLATGLIAVATWLGLLALMSAGWVDWALWIFCTAPVGVWLLVLALPVLWHARRGAVAVVAALASTAEAWLARAGYSIDLNNDGYIGWKNTAAPLAIEPAEIVRPMLVASVAQQGIKMMASDAPATFPTEPAEPSPRPRLWELPNGVKVPQQTIEQFIDGVFVRGLARGSWVGTGLPLDRDQYDGLINLLVSTGLLIDRKLGTTGKLSVETAEAARKQLKMN